MFVRKLIFVILFALVIINVTPFSYIPVLAESDNRHSQAKNDGTGVGEGSPEDKKIRHAMKLNSHRVLPKVSMGSPQANILPSIQNKCNCVIFRLDDVQDYWLGNIQTIVMDQFIQKNQPFSVGPILNYIGDDANVINKVKQGQRLGLFELFVHGWNHVAYSQLNLTEQISTLQMANDKMKTLFGNASTIFVPPYDVYNHNTLIAMKTLGYQTISAAEWNETSPWYVADGIGNIMDNQGIYHLPESIGFASFDSNGDSVRIPNSQILDTANSEISSQGYAVITLHAQDFRQRVNGTAINVLNQTEINDLDSLIDSVISKNYHIRTFNQVVEFKHPTTTTIVTSAENPSSLGKTVNFTATISHISLTGIPTGVVKFTIDGVVTNYVTLVNGNATLTVLKMLIGSHSITAQYLGDSNYLSSNSTSFIQTVKHTAKATLTSNTQHSNFGKKVSFIIKVSSVSPRKDIPTGLVKFTIDGIDQMSVSLSAKGKAIFTSNSMAAGSHSITAQYLGDSNYLPSDSLTLVHKINLHDTSPPEADAFEENSANLDD